MRPSSSQNPYWRRSKLNDRAIKFCRIFGTTPGDYPCARRAIGGSAAIGPLISQKQLTRAMAYIVEGKAGGVEIVAGGCRLDRKGYFVHPTVPTRHVEQKAPHAYSSLSVK